MQIHTHTHKHVFIIYATSVAEGNVCSHSLTSRRESAQRIQSISDMQDLRPVFLPANHIQAENQIEPDLWWKLSKKSRNIPRRRQTQRSPNRADTENGQLYLRWLRLN